MTKLLLIDKENFLQEIEDIIGPAILTEMNKQLPKVIKQVVNHERSRLLALLEQSADIKTKEDVIDILRKLLLLKIKDDIGE